MIVAAPGSLAVTVTEKAPPANAEAGADKLKCSPQYDSARVWLYTLPVSKPTAQNAEGDMAAAAKRTLFPVLGLAPAVAEPHVRVWVLEIQVAGLTMVWKNPLITACE